MGIEEMHIMFRELGQQMGIQTTRAIFSENIDICINSAINEITRSTIRQNVGASFQDKVQRDNAKVSPINGLYTLYTKGEIAENDITGEGTQYNPYKCTIDSSNVYLYTGFDCVYADDNVRNCRLIERELLFDTLYDFCNRPTKSYPIVTVFGTDTDLLLNVYTGQTKSSVKPRNIIYTYIRKPAIVLLDEEDSNNNVNCDLPEYRHNDVVLGAINFYLQSLSGRKSDNGEQS